MGRKLNIGGPEFLAQHKQLLKGIDSGGKTHMRRYLLGEEVSASQAAVGKCFDCMGGYVDGRRDCEIPTCPLYPWMPYAHMSVAEDGEEAA